MRMFIIAIVCLLPFVTSCGQIPPEEFYIDYDLNAVVWEGYPRNDAYVDDIWTRLISCNGSPYEPQPFTIFVDQAMINCNGNTLARACAQFNGLIVVTIQTVSSTSYVLAHEYQHWSTGMDNTWHYTPEFDTCVDQVSAINSPYSYPWG